MKHIFSTTVAVLSLALFGGCQKYDHDHAGNESSHAAAEQSHNHEGESYQVRYDKEHGLELSEEVAKALNVKTQKAQIRKFKAKAVLTGQVVSAHPKVIVNASVPVGQAEVLKTFSAKDGKLLGMDRLSGEVSGLADLVYEMNSAQKTESGTFMEIELESSEASALTIPESSILEGMDGKYVYIFNGEAYHRAKVKTGMTSEGFAEVAGGIDEGDLIVVSPVVELWLIELRLTKGGGHSH